MNYKNNFKIVFTNTYIDDYNKNIRFKTYTTVCI